MDRETVSLQELEAQKQDAQDRLEEMDQQKHKLEDMLNEVRMKCQEESQMVSNLLLYFIYYLLLLYNFVNCELRKQSLSSSHSGSI